MKSYSVIIMLIFTISQLTNCNSRNIEVLESTGVTNTDSLKQVLISTDFEFSNSSEKGGMKQAFLKYVADNGVLLRPNTYPIEGKAAIKNCIAHFQTVVLFSHGNLRMLILHDQVIWDTPTQHTSC